jgi:hypothetical protein
MAGLRAALCRLQARVGLAPFLNDVVAPLNVAVGDAWLHGDSAAVGRAPLHRDPAGAAAPGHRCRAAPAGADRAACPADHLPRRAAHAGPADGRGHAHPGRLPLRQSRHADPALGHRAGHAGLPQRHRGAELHRLPQPQSGHRGPEPVLRNYPVIGHLRFLLEYVRPRSASTSSRATTRRRRSRARSARWSTSAPRASPTSGPLAPSWMWAPSATSGSTTRWHPPHWPRTTFASPSARPPGCTQPYSASVFNISAMSFGALSANAILALNGGAQRGRLCARHRRRLDQPAPPRARRRPDLGDRLGLLRLPQRRRQLQRERSPPTRATRRSR